MIYARHGKRGTIWYIRYRANGREHREAAGPTRRHAEALLARRKTEAIEQRTGIRLLSGRILLGDLIVRYIAQAEQLGRDADTMRRKAKHVEDAPLGVLAADRITEGDLDRYVASRRGQGAAPGSINRELSAVRSALRWGERRGMIQRGCMPHIAMLKEPPGRCRVITRDEETRLLAACGPRLAALVRLAVNCGARMAEMLDLRWRDVDLVGGWLHIEDTKSGDRRDTPLNRSACEALASRPQGGQDDLVFATRTGKRWQRSPVDRAFQAACRKAGIVGVRFHDTRHTAGGRVATATGGLLAVQALLGHRSIVTSARYGHLAAQSVRDAVDAIDPGRKGGTEAGKGEVEAPKPQE